MRRRWLVRTLIVVGTAAFLAVGILGAPAADANDGIGVPGGALPTTAGPVANATSCDLTGGPYQDQDVWTFAAASGAQLDSMTATFLDEGGLPAQWQLTGTDQALDLAGHSVGWLRTPRGWTLTGATAQAGTGGDVGPLLLVGSCPAQPVAETAGPAALAPPARDENVAPVPTLPTTGQDVGGMLAVGLALVIGGGLLLTVRRRRPRPAVTAAPRDDANVWTYPRP